MTNYLRTRLPFLIGSAGGLVFVFGIFILSSGILLTTILRKGELRYLKPLACQYWAGIPTILVGVVLLLTAVVLVNKKFWASLIVRNTSSLFVLVTLVLTLIVIIEESSTGAGSSLRECDKFKEEDPWFYILLCVTDILLVLCSFMMLLLFVDWIVAPKLSAKENIPSVSNEKTPQESLERMSSPQAQKQPWNDRFDSVPLLTV